MYAEKASTSLREVVDGIQAIADSAKKIKEISIEQADSMEQVEVTAERIAEVVQNNSAAAQETSATSEELTAQATTLSGIQIKTIRIDRVFSGWLFFTQLKNNRPLFCFGQENVFYFQFGYMVIYNKNIETMRRLIDEI